MGVFRANNAVELIGREKYSSTYRLVSGRGANRGFRLGNASPSIVLPLGRKEHLAHISDVRVSHILDTRVMTYTANHENGRELRVAVHDDSEGMDVWSVHSLNRHLTGSGMVVPEYLHNGDYVLYYGDQDLRVAFSKNLVAWHTSGHALAAPRKGGFDKDALQVVSVTHIEQGLLVLYASSQTKRGQTTVSIGAMLCSRNNPERVIWRSDEPLHSHSVREKDRPQVLGAVVYENEIVVYLTTESEKLVTLEFANPYALQTKARRHHTRLHRFPENPVLSPTQYEWESEAVFNPAALVDNGRVHLLYRAMGPDGVSRIGYASSADGVHFDERLAHPVYEPTYGFGAPDARRGPRRHYDLALHPSGGGWAGCEDPRIVAIDGHAYMTFMAFNGWNYMRQALTAISLDDLNQKNWQWRPPVLISRPDQTSKNWVIFPEKISGKYAILHGLSPKIHIDYVDSLDDFDGQTYINSLPPAGGAGFHDPRRKDHWDSRVRGAGAPPLKTPMGWLLLYHATDKRDPGKYKLGAMLLDSNDPTKILYRASAPILEPEEWYENDGKPGVVYTCGAVIMNDNLIVYYGGGDKRIAIARANVRQFLKGLITHHAVELTPVQ